MKKILLLVLSSFMILSLSAQKKSIDESVYDSWKQVKTAVLSNDGNWSVYVVDPQEGNGVLYVRDNKNGKEYSYERGSAPVLFDNGKWVMFRIKKPLALTRKYEIDAVKKDKQEKDSVVVLRFSDMLNKTVVGSESFRTSAEGALIAWSEEMPKADKKKEDETAKEEPKTEGVKKDDVKKDKPFSFGKAYKLTVMNPDSGVELVVDSVSKYELSADGKSVIYDKVKDGKRYVYSALLDKKGFNTVQLASLDLGSVGDFAIDKSSKLIAFSATRDTSKVKKYDIYYGQPSAVSVVVSSLDSKMPKNFTVAGSLGIDKEGKLFFGIRPVAKINEPKKVAKDQKFSFDLWSWHDTLLQTQQMGSSKKMIEDFCYASVYSPKTKQWVRLTDKQYSTVDMPRVEGSPYALLRDNYKYTWFSTITSPTGTDVYVIDLKTNTPHLLFERFKGRVQLSPTSKYVLYWDVDTKSWNSYDILNKKHTRIATDINYPLDDELNDVPSYASPYGVFGWTEGDKRVLVMDRYDIYSVDPNGLTKSENLTRIGRTTKKTFTRVGQFVDREETFVDLKKPIYLKSFDEVSRDAGFWVLIQGKEPQKLVEGANIYTIMSKAKDSNKMLFSKESYTMVPDMWIGDMDNITAAQKITDINPHSKDYKWGSVQLMSWTDFNGDTVEGLLYLPENYSKDKRYPTIVYFYERNTETLNKFHMPQPSWSIIIPSVCVSNDYVVFIPDIKYKIGFPGKSSYDAIVSGTMALIERGISDKDRIGLQGQSWGGYASSYLVTQTDLYACAAPGAPVSNMTSAYGGIRWTTGMARSFQYENGQSRIGATPWERRDLYIDNSAIFFADRVNTPVFMRHDDADEAVPWYQGIEFYVALRRLGKPVWMINYNNEPHNLRNRYARKDFDKRLYQFLDYYLKGTDMPRWMKDGISQQEKGNEMKFDLVK